VEEDVGVDDDGAEFDRENPNIMEPETIEVVFRVNPTLR
jgi:hypothetical protein